MDALITRSVVVEVGEGLRLGTEIVFGGKVDGGVMLRRARNGGHTIEESADASLAEEGQASHDRFFKALGFRRLGVMKK